MVLIVGDYTARVGDPSGRSATRPELAPAEIDANARTFQAQALRVLDSERLEVRFNSEWLDMTMADLFKLARTTTVAQLLERDDFAKRFAAHEPISVLELLYPLLQGYDSVAVRADVELGGTDQKFNLLLGRQIQRLYGQPEQVILTMPLLTGTDGELKMSKSVGNYIGVTDAPDDIYGKTLSIPDGSLETWYRLLLGSEPPIDLGPRDAKRALARALVARFHGREAAETAEREFDRVHIQHRPPEEMPTVTWPADRADAPPAGAPGRRLRDLDLRGPPQPGPGRGQAGRAGGRQWDPRPPRVRGRRQAFSSSASVASPGAGRGRPRRAASLETPGNGPHRRHHAGVHSVADVWIDRGCTCSRPARRWPYHDGVRAGGVHDLQALLDRLIRAGDYEHNRRNHDTNAHAHLRAAVIGPSESIPVVDGRLALGTWQQVVLIDFDDRPRRRTSRSRCCRRPASDGPTTPGPPLGAGRWHHATCAGAGARAILALYSSVRSGIADDFGRAPGRKPLPKRCDGL